MGKMLIVEDYKPMSNMLIDLLEVYKVPLECEVAKDGVEGWEKIKQGGYDIILLDLALPNKDGFGVLRDMEQAKMLRKIPVIATTALGGQVREFFWDLKNRTGIEVPLVFRPFEPRNLVETINQELAKFKKS